MKRLTLFCLCLWWTAGIANAQEQITESEPAPPEATSTAVIGEPHPAQRAQPLPRCHQMDSRVEASVADEAGEDAEVASEGESPRLRALKPSLHPPNRSSSKAI